MPIVALLLTVLPVAVSLANEQQAQLDEPPKPEANPAKDAPDAAEYERMLGLKDGEVLKRIAPPYPKSRMAYYQKREQILNEQLENKLILAFVEIARKAHVARGEFNFIPIDEQRQRIEIYGDRLNRDPRRGGGGSGDFDDFLMWVGMWVGMWIGEPVVSDLASPPTESLSWHNNLEGPYTGEESRRAKDPQLVLQHVSEQTGITFKQERRKMRVLVVEWE